MTLERRRIVAWCLFDWANSAYFAQSFAPDVTGTAWLFYNALLPTIAPPDRLGRVSGWFWVTGMLIGVFAGPNQAASRLLMARFAPPGSETNSSDSSPSPGG